MAWMLLGLGAVLAVIVVAPVRLRAEVNSTPARVRVELGLLWGLVRFALLDSARPRKPRREAPKAKAKAGSWRPPKQFLRLLPGAALEALGKIRVETCRGALWFGLEDPAMTGELYGRLAAPLAALGGGRWLRLVPVFDRETLEGEAELAVSLVPARLLPLAARLVWALR
ncbi:DUF2953 domain-containing protein [Pararhodobacter zhoushanensis]|uniref:DUF2953 domain-containing protein n=1 Tax=Pararhodobacter zhoushanensis TaxID=2479545 RepID=A0ABT3H105_9RHOB|nr:DUF2953 domain-containing protein [Pararhodobacter zhoushanensis]MCW1933500.1 DUF2953 domain-containing protein [Pararhodobacter zhoushanensis]